MNEELPTSERIVRAPVATLLREAVEKRHTGDQVASFGESLKRARKARNMSLQEIAETTKIGTRTLQALEDERFDQLPGGIFNKGFVRSYARCVGLDEEKTVAAYMAAARPETPETDMETISTQVAAARPKRSEPAVNPATLMSVLAVLVALGVGVFWFVEHRKEAREQAALHQPAPSPVVNATPPITVPAEAPTVANGAQNSTQPVAPTTSAPAVSVPPPVAETKEASPKTESAAKTAQGASAPVEVSISATARSWISVKSDGKAVESLTMDPENPERSTRSYKAHDQLKLVVGNPAGVMVTYNGKQEGALGVEGHRAVVTFTPEGMAKR